jgi:hypothetical protein
MYFFSKIPYFWLFSQKVWHCNNAKFPIHDHKWLIHIHCLQSWLTSAFLEMKHNHSSCLKKLPPAETHTRMFVYCNILLWPTTALASSLITDVSYCCMCWICTSFTSSSLMWVNELCNKRYLFFQILTAKSLSCTNYEIITKTIIPPVATPVTHTL